MSLGSDWLSDHYFEQDFPFGFPSDTWRTKDGRRIPLKEMTESHILNCMKVVGEDDGWYHRFQEELFSRGITNRAQVVRELEGLIVSARSKTGRWISPNQHKALLYAIGELKKSS